MFTDDTNISDATNSNLSDSQDNQTDQPNEQTNQPTTFDWNDPGLADEPADQINPDQDADEFPPPPPDGIYLCNWDFAEPDEDKRWEIRQGSKSKFLMTTLAGTIVDCDDQKIPGRCWINRKLRAMIMTIVSNDGTSTMTDFEKALGLKSEVVRISRLGEKPKQFVAHREVIT